MKKYLKSIVYASVVSASIVASSMAYGQLPAIQHYGGISYITGGFGIDESTAIKEAMPMHSLVLTFASSDEGRAAYISSVQVVVRDVNDSNVLNVESNGPFLLANLPSGQYKVFATYKGITKSASVLVKDDQSTRVVFDWPFKREQSESKPELNRKSEPSNASDYIPGLEVMPSSIKGQS